MYKIETHMHVSETSGCAHLTADEMIKRYAEAGYDTVFSTDHYVKNYFLKLGDIPWQEKAERYLSGYRAALKAGEKYGVKVLLGMELSFVHCRNDYLVYGITEDFIKNNPELYESSYEKFYPIAKENGFLVIQAHALRDGVCNPTLEFVDGLEIYNSNPRHEDYNDKVTAIAKEHNLPFTAGSDAHRADDAALSGLYSEAPIETVEDFIALVKSGKAEIIRG